MLRSKVACPATTYTNVTGTQNVSYCNICPAGYYCPQATNQPIDCPRGYYCVEGAENPTPCPIGRYGSDTNLKAAEECPLCDLGWYCDAPGLLNPRSPCDPGYVCYRGASTAGPIDGVTGELCPAGGYCKLGSYYAEPCPLGTYSNVTGAVNEYDCFECDPGYYCSEVAGGEPTGKCWGGHYCTGGAKSPRQNWTEPGSYATNGSVMATDCDTSTYQPHDRQSECIICEPGFYCPDKAMTDHIICPPGRYCLNGSLLYTDCPPGTYSNITGAESEDNCTVCETGFYCQNRGATSPTGKCAAGHICYSGALADDLKVNDDPTGNKTIITWGDICAAGFYCPAGTSKMWPCPVGTYNPHLGRRSEAECLPCDPGYYCNGTNLTATTGPCDAGYYCTGGAWIPDPVDNTTGNICPQFHQCPEGSDSPSLCGIGTYANNTGMPACVTCLPGYFCVPGEAPRICEPVGKYCRATANDGGPITQPDLCPVGTFNPYEGMWHADNCTTCTGGYYCSQQGLVNVSGPLQAGFFSLYGSTVVTPAVDWDCSITSNTGSSQSYYCPKGYYCPSGTISPIPCPPGTYGYSKELESLAQCTDCDPGKYCPTSNMTAAGSDCEQGYYCSSKSPTATPLNETYGDECPTGYICPTGSATPDPCPAGQYQNETRQWVCKTCPAGFYCPMNTSYPFSCPSGYWCPESSISGNTFPCLVGTFNNLTERYAFVHKQVGHLGKNAMQVKLRERFWIPCSGALIRSITSRCVVCRKISGVLGRQKMADLPKKRVAMDKAPFAHTGMDFFGPFLVKRGRAQVKRQYCGSTGLSWPSGDCDPGWYCTANAQMPQPSNAARGGRCEPGYYCPAGSSAPIPCTPGQYCSEYGLEATNGSCDPGYYCTLQASQSTPTDGTTGNSCPVGQYCVAGSANGTYCPPGTLLNTTGGRSLDDCMNCTAGKYCAGYGNGSPTGGCSEGYYCPPGMNSPTPAEYPCPQGHYCPTGSHEPVRCDPGYYQDETTQPSCKLCVAGYYCDNTLDPVVMYNGTHCPEGDCAPGHWCISGVDREYPNGNNASSLINET